MANELSLAYQELTTGAQTFTADFNKNVASDIQGNFVTSALSVYMVLSMTAYGAKSTTAAQMRQALRLPKNDDAQAYQAFQALDESLNNVENVTLKVAQRIYISKEFPVKSTFKDLTRTYFHSECTALDFKQSDESAAAINQWSKEHTNNKINEIVTADDMKGDPAMFLINAVYFKGDWLEKFENKNTKFLPFYISNSKFVQVPTMFTEQNLYYRELEDLQASVVGLPYRNENIVMLIIIPDKIDGLKHLQQNLHKFDINEPLYQTKVRLSLPKFKIETSVKLEKPLKKMGMTQMFSDKADFQGISDQEVKVESVIQKAFIEVNEEGSEAAAVTVVDVVARTWPQPPLEIKVDKPFLYHIADLERKIILFSGRVMEPKY